jgi:hypothetical protein
MRATCTSALARCLALCVAAGSIGAAAAQGGIGSGRRDTTGAAGNSIGRHLEGSFTWAAIPRRLSVETGFAQLSAGRFAEQTAGAQFRGDPQYFYLAVTVTF